MFDQTFVTLFSISCYVLILTCLICVDPVARNDISPEYELNLMKLETETVARLIGFSRNESVMRSAFPSFL